MFTINYVLPTYSHYLLIHVNYYGFSVINLFYYVIFIIIALKFESILLINTLFVCVTTQAPSHLCCAPQGSWRCRPMEYCATCCSSALRRQLWCGAVVLRKMRRSSCTGVRREGGREGWVIEVDWSKEDNEGVVRGWVGCSVWVGGILRAERK